MFSITIRLTVNLNLKFVLDLKSSDFFSDADTCKTMVYFNPLSANPTKWTNTRKEFVGF